MKKHIFYSLLGFFIFSSSQVMAEWTIPGTHCILDSRGYFENNPTPYGLIYSAYHDERNAVINPIWGRNDSKPHVPMRVKCTSPIYANYGDNLDMDFIVDSNSSEAPLTCQGFSLDEKGNVVQETDVVSTGRTSSPVRLQASQRNKIRNTKPVMVMATCSIPDRGGKCGERATSPCRDASGLLNIKVY